MSLKNAESIAIVLSADHKKSAPWYKDILGLEVLGETPFNTIFKLGGAMSRATMNLTSVPDFKPSAHTVLGFNVETLEPHIEALKAKGVTFLIYDGFGQDANGIWSSPDGATRLMWFNDSEGNNLMLVEKGKK